MFADLTEDDLRTIFDGNVHAQLALIRAVLPSMLERGDGTIVNMISATAYTDPQAKSGEGGWGMGYAMSKAAFARVAPLLHVEHGGDGLRVFSVDPGFVITERMEASGHVAQYAGRYAGIRPDVIARAIRWLATDPASDELRGQVVIAQREVKRRGRCRRRRVEEAGEDVADGVDEGAGAIVDAGVDVVVEGDGALVEAQLGG